MATEVSTEPVSRRRRSVGALAGLLVGLVAVTAYQFWPGRGLPGAAPVRSRSDATADQARMGEAPPEVRLETLQAGGPEIAAANRNPFRFQVGPAPAPAQPLRGPAPERPAPSPASGVAGAGAEGTAGDTQAPPPITLKFIGTIEGAGVGKIAALSDGKFVFHGREGDVIEGRYRIVKIGIESIILEYLDGRGRQTIRLTG